MRDDNNTRNTLIFIVSAVILLIAYQFFVIDPQTRKRQAEIAKQAPAITATVNGKPVLAAPSAVSRDTAAAASPRVDIETPSLSGSLSLRGARLDDLYLSKYRQTIDKDARAVELLRPEGAEHPWFTDIGWVGQNIAGLPTPTTNWTLASGATLAPGKPVTLTYANGAGLNFTRVISVDEQFMFTVADTVANTSGQAITLAPYGSVQRQGVPAHLGRDGIVHEGAIAWMGKLEQLKYDKWKKAKAAKTFNATGGWIGITDKYWLAAIIPDQKQAITGTFNTRALNGVQLFDANYVGGARTIPNGTQISNTVHVFAGAKRVPVLQGYEESLGATSLDSAVDWGMLWFLTRPIFSFLAFLQSYVGNFGVAILILTVVVRLILFPLANKQYESMTKMKKVQPQMEELRKRHKDDPAKQQQELLALYQREKVNPVAGCLPILLTIPVFFALFKVLNVSIEMRHAPFVGFIKDLSAADPTTIFNLFGLIPWDPGTAPLIGSLLAYGQPPGFLHIGIMAILYGITTWLTTAMSPPAADPMQQRIMQLMPLLFTFIMAQFAIGLLIYYTWSNVLSIAQQYIIMRRFEVDTPIDAVIRKLTGKSKPAS
jgi:YidC/Oxa1 family membrane protein insertase